jgi:hypothetical protein
MPFPSYCNEAIIPADAPREVISQAAPTDSIKLPKLDARLASQTARKIGCQKGESADGWHSNGLSPPLSYGLTRLTDAQSTRIRHIRRAWWLCTGELSFEHCPRMIART